jgi:hypothetical protein
MTWFRYLDTLVITLGIGCLIGLALGVVIVRV